MSEAADKKLTPDAKERLVDELRGKLSRRRLRVRPFAVLGAILILAAMGGIWYGMQPPESLPPLMLIVYDALESDGVVKAQIVAPGEPDAKLEGLDVDWKMRDAAHDEQMTTKTDATGTATYVVGSGDKRTEKTLLAAINPIMHVAFPEQRGHDRRDKSVRLVSSPSFGSPMLIVPLESFVVDGKPPDWKERELSRMPKPPSRSMLGIANCKSGLADQKCEVIYSSGDAGWETYQRMRDWLNSYKGNAEADVPTGPLLHERAESIEERLKGRMGDKVRVWRAAK